MSFIIKYRRFINLIFTYDNQEIENITSFPTKDCQKLMNRFNLIFRKTSEGFNLYYGEIPFRQISERLCFRFGFLLPSREFIKRVDNNAHSALYFNNLSENDVGTAENVIMKSEDKVSKGDFCNIKTQSFNRIYFSSEVPKDDKRPYYSLSHELNPNKKQQVEFDMPEDKDFIIIPINGPKVANYFSDPGLYNLEIGTSVERIYLDNELGKIKTDGVIELFWDEKQILVPEKTGIQYKINFKSKS